MADEEIVGGNLRIKAVAWGPPLGILMAALLYSQLQNAGRWTQDHVALQVALHAKVCRLEDGHVPPFKILLYVSQRFGVSTG